MATKPSTAKTRAKARNVKPSKPPAQRFRPVDEYSPMALALACTSGENALYKKNADAARRDGEQLGVEWSSLRMTHDETGRIGDHVVLDEQLVTLGDHVDSALSGRAALREGFGQGALKVLAAELRVLRRAAVAHYHEPHTRGFDGDLFLALAGVSRRADAAAYVIACNSSGKSALDRATKKRAGGAS